MGLYLCIFDEADEELEGVEVGHYEDFDLFRKAVAKHVERLGADFLCPTLMLHSDCEGEWTSVEARSLESELTRIRAVFRKLPPIPLTASWKSEVAKRQGVKLTSLHDCFFDVDGEPLIDRLIDLCQTSQKTGCPVLFQ